MNPQDPSLPPIREFQDRGVKWLLESPEYVRSLFAIVAPDLARALDFDRLSALPASMIPDSLRKQEADLVFRIPFRSAKRGRAREVLVYLLIEHQSTPDPVIRLRVLLYMCGLWDRQYRQWLERKGRRPHLKLLPVIPLVFYTGSGRWEAPLSLAELMDLPDALAGFVPQHDLLFLNLKATPSEQVTAQGDPLGWLLSVVQKDEATQTELSAVLERALEQLKALLPEQRAGVVKALQYLLLLIYYRREREEAAELAAMVQGAVEDSEVMDMGRTMAQELVEEGRTRGVVEGRQAGLAEGRQAGLAEGRQAGLAEGRLQSKQDDLLEVLGEKFGVLTERVAGSIRAIEDAERLSELIRQVVHANSLRELGF